MRGHVWLADQQMERRRPFFPRSRGKPRVDDRRVLSGMICIKKKGLQWKDAPAVFGPPTTLCNRFVRWPRTGVFARTFVEPARPGPEGTLIMTGSTHLEAQRTAASLSRGDRDTGHRSDQGRSELEAAHGL